MIIISNRTMKRKTLGVFILILFFNSQILNTVVNSSFIFAVQSQEETEPEAYYWLWQELAGAPGPISGEDVVYWGEDLGPYHNYTELTDKLVLPECYFS